ncbi:hypothetical protein [Pseudomonas sp. SR18]|uniref:hypothetical protein n=1 Tax=Pseudomonas sp. SR18 TaxID=1461074 RepID=UPI0020334C10|nr:hypothetical protein [Pseudomonas sp. SR18]MCM2362483.1 hypothetical protein [Pseudomonas sp. SR18]
MRASLVLTGTFLLSACTTDRMTDPAIVTSVNEKSAFTALTTTADRRIFIINNSTNRTCGEPPAGVAENISASLSNSLSVALKTQAGDPSARNSFAESAAKTVANVSQKTQGLMLYEAMSSGLCMAYANDDKMTPLQYAAELQAAGKLAVELIKLELKESSGKIGPDQKTLEPNPVPSASLTSSDASSVAAAAAGASAVALATNSAEAGKETGIAIADSIPVGATTAQQASIVKKLTNQAVTQVMRDSAKGKEAATEAVTNFSQSTAGSSASRNLTNALDNVKK